MAQPTRAPPGTSSSSFSCPAISTKQLITSFLLATLCYYLGSFTATSILHDQIIHLQQELNDVQEKYEKTRAELSTAKTHIDEIQKASLVETKLEMVEEEKKDKIVNSHQPRFTKKVPFMGMAKIPKKDFTAKFDFGSPVEDVHGNDVLMFYTDHAIPSGLTYEEKENIINNGDGGITTLDPVKATKNCMTMHVATIPKSKGGGGKSCLAVVQNYDNHHLQKWMRQHNKITDPLVFVNRGQNERSRIFVPPTSSKIDKNWKMLKRFFNTVDDVLAELKPIATKVAKDNTIIVMTCNHGQSELLMNFVCNARAKGFDVSNILLFPTDQETKELAEGLGLTTYHDDNNFGELPKGEAKNYGDRNFTAMMFAKVLCVQLINFLGYDVLFQDVDVVWYKNPVEYFHDKNNFYHDFDMYFQDDGAHSNRYAPYSANSGFYYVRNNDKTKYLFTSLLYHNDMILQWNSHQQALVQLLAEQASLFGLKVKVLDRETKDFPGGWHYHSHRMKGFMKEIVQGEYVPQIFHMSWTTNKRDKLKYYQQMGEWYLDSKCIGSTADKILGSGSQNDSTTTRREKLVQPCCLAEPKIVCHYRDKPSKIPCKHSDPIDKGRPSWW